MKNIKSNLLLLAFSIILFSCTINKSQTNKHILYVYNHPNDVNENEYIKLYIKGFDVKGYFYGTSDELDKAREGYLPGYFVTSLRNFKWELNDSISFDISITNNDILKNPINLNCESTNQAIDNGNDEWDNNIQTTLITYKGYIENDSLVFINKLMRNKIFIKK